MMRFTNALIAGAAGAAATTLLHELTRRLSPDAPRIDLLGMQALAHAVRGAGGRPPQHGLLYGLTLVGDLGSNSTYFSLVGARRSNAIGIGSALGIAAGLGAVYLPPWLGLDARPTRRTPATGALTVALYTAGGITAGLSYHALSS